MGELVNTKAVMLDMGYSEKSWKSAKTRVLNKLALVEDAKDTYVLSKSEMIAFVGSVAGGNSKYAERAKAISKDMNDGVWDESYMTPYVEGDAKDNSKNGLVEENESLKKELEELKAEIEALKSEIEKNLDGALSVK